MVGRTAGDGEVDVNQLIVDLVMAVVARVSHAAARLLPAGPMGKSQGCG